MAEPQTTRDLEAGLEPSRGKLAWEDLRYTVKDRKTKQPIELVNKVSGQCSVGQMLAILGPSGAGKSTLLDCLAGRKKLDTGKIYWGGSEISQKDLARGSSYVEQDDALLGSLTVGETFWYSTRLSFPYYTEAQVKQRVDDILSGLGLSQVDKHRIGTPIQRGISGGQKRRVTIGTSLVTLPAILFLDEPTSGLDSATSYEVMSAIRALSSKHSITVIATIHSPSWETFALFDNTLLLAKGQIAYQGSVHGVSEWFAGLGFPPAAHSNPADHMMRLVSSDFGHAEAAAGWTLANFLGAWALHRPTHALEQLSYAANVKDIPSSPLSAMGSATRRRWSGFIYKTWYLVQRNIINYNRNLLAYGVRFGMYVGMGILVATVWVNLPQEDSRINDRLSVHFFSVAFLGFMSVAGIPSFLEERSVLLREKRNGLYGALPFVVSNTAVNIPYLFLCSLIYAVIVYWSVGLHAGAVPFFKFLAYLFVGVYAAETQSLLIAAIIPIFVAALAVAAFANGFWMAVQGYFMRNLPAFWHSWAHWIDYQTYAFQLMVKNDFTGLLFGCQVVDEVCSCSFAQPDAEPCAVTGSAVVAELGYSGSNDVLYTFLIVIIIMVYRVGFWAALALTK